MTGDAGLSVKMVAGQSAVTEVWCANPLKACSSPCPRGSAVSACFSSSFGGGMVAGDQTSLNVARGRWRPLFSHDPGIDQSLSPQSIAKTVQPRTCPHIWRSIHSWLLRQSEVQSFADSIYLINRRGFFLHAGAESGPAGLVFVPGARLAENDGAFNRLQSRNEIFVDGDQRLLDSLLLDRAHGPIDGEHRLGRFNCVGMIVIFGQRLRDDARALLEGIRSQPVERHSRLIFSASPIRDGAVLRVAGEFHEEVARHVYQSLGFVSRLLQDDP